MTDLRQVVRDRARVEGAEAWIDSLPELVASLCADWDLTVGATLLGGTQAYVCEAVLGDGTLAALKLACNDDFANEIAVLRHAAGEGDAAVFESDVERGALLLERLGPKLHDLGLPIEQRLVILSDVATRFWRPAADLGLPTGAERVSTGLAALSIGRARPCSPPPTASPPPDAFCVAPGPVRGASATQNVRASS